VFEQSVFKFSVVATLLNTLHLMATSRGRSQSP
jgi:hypothetical protein